MITNQRKAAMAGLDQHVVSTFMSDNPSFVKRWFQSNIDIVTLQVC